MASKQYISIIRLFEYCNISTGPDFDLPRTKKQLLAEFNIAHGELIEISGFTYTRHDVFEEIDRPDFSTRFNFHKELWNSPQILRMLETNIVELESLEQEFKPFWSNKTFDEFFSPYFSGPFNYISRTLLTTIDFDKMSDLLGYEGFLLAQEREEAFRPLADFLEENLKLLRNVSADNYKIMRPKIAPWIDTEWHNFLNALPVEFYDAKVNIATRLINSSAAVQKSHRRDCRKISDQLVYLSDMPENLRKIIVSNHKIYSGSTFAIKPRQGFFIFWIIFALIRLVASNGCANSIGTVNGFDESSFKIDSIKIRPSKDSTNHFHKNDKAPEPIIFK